VPLFCSHSTGRARIVSSGRSNRRISLDAHDDVLVAVAAAVADGDRDAASLQQAGEVHDLRQRVSPLLKSKQPYRTGRSL
jgi:hypothetical protein